MSPLCVSALHKPFACIPGGPLPLCSLQNPVTNQCSQTPWDLKCRKTTHSCALGSRLVTWFTGEINTLGHSDSQGWLTRSKRCIRSLPLPSATSHWPIGLGGPSCEVRGTEQHGERLPPSGVFHPVKHLYWALPPPFSGFTGSLGPKQWSGKT